jgi:hypothetical protein
MRQQEVMEAIAGFFMSSQSTAMACAREPMFTIGKADGCHIHLAFLRWGAMIYFPETRLAFHLSFCNQLLGVRGELHVLFAIMDGKGHITGSLRRLK